MNAGSQLLPKIGFVCAMSATLMQLAAGNAGMAALSSAHRLVQLHGAPRRAAGSQVTGRAFTCRRSRPRPRKRPDPCRWHGCSRFATQARWGCKVHWFHLPPALRDRLWKAATAILPGYSTSPAFDAVAGEADAYSLERETAPPRPDRREPELPL